MNISIRSDVIADAKALKLNISQISNEALKLAVKQEKERRWLEENKEAIAAQNAWIEKHGLPITPIWMRDDFEGF